jgi:L-glyceraldehyde 3-phosphate reductase
MNYIAAPDRYESASFRRTGRSGLDLPAVSLGLWHNFGDTDSVDVQRAILRRAFDRGVTHFDLANNYGPPYGGAERNFGTLFAQDFKAYRDELIISTKAGWDMWPGPYGQGGGSRKYLLASLDQSLDRMGLDYVDIFYSHRFDPTTPLEETMGALDTAVRSGRALYAGISSYSPQRTREAAEILRSLGTPLLIHQPSYSMVNRWIENGLLDTLGELGVGCIAFSPLAQGLLTDKYLNGVPAGSRASKGSSLSVDQLSERNLGHVRALNEVARERGQSLAQLALAWALRDSRVTSVLIGGQQRRSAGRQPRRVGQAVVHGRRTRPDRQARGGRGHRPLGVFSGGVTRRSWRGRVWTTSATLLEQPIRPRQASPPGVRAAGVSALCSSSRCAASPSRPAPPSPTRPSGR